MKKLISILTSFLFFAVMPGITLAQDEPEEEAGETWVESTGEITPKKFKKALLWDLVPIFTVGAWGSICLTLESDPRGDDPRAACLEPFPVVGPFLFSLSYIPIDAYSEIPKTGIITFSTLKILLGVAFLPFGFAAALVDEEDDYQEEYDKRWKMIKESWLIWGSTLFLIQSVELICQASYINKYNDRLASRISLMPELRGKDKLYLTLQYSF